MCSKKCSKCKETKDLNEFYKHKQKKCGYESRCKQCARNSSRANSQRVGNQYDISIKGVFRVIYKSQKRNQKLRGHGEMPYTKDELISWCMDNNFNDIYNKWVESGHDKELKPSVDRIDDFKGYSMDNIRLGTWRQNREHQHQDIINGLGTSGLRCKALLKMDSEMNVIHEYISYSSAQRDMGYSLEYQIKHKKKCRSGFFWKYKAP